MSAFTDQVAGNAKTELGRFKNGKGRETDDPFAGFVGEYWLDGLGVKHRDGRTEVMDANGKRIRPAWSAAFISFIMRKSGAGDAFFYSEAHIHYVVKAIRDAKQAGTTAKFLGRDPEKYTPKVGDLINAGRGASKSSRFNTVLREYGRREVPKGNFLATHSDIVVAVDSAGRTLTTIGGNVNVDTVGEKTWDLKADGTLKKGGSLITVIECLL